MSITLQRAIDGVRSVHPAFSRYLVPDKSLADFFTREQQQLVTAAIERDRTYLAQSLPILFDLGNASIDAPGTAGAGTAGGLPGLATTSGTLAVSEATVGSAVSVAQGTILVADTAVTAATATTLTGLGVVWTTNAYAGYAVVIVAGKGANTSPRTIASNTASAVTVSSWEVTPDTTSVFRIVQPVPTLTAALGVVTDLPSVVPSRGYLVKLNAQGVPTIDYTAPLVAHVSAGVPLPPFLAILSGTVRGNAVSGSVAQTDYNATSLTLIHPDARYNPPKRPAAYVQGQALFLVGNRSEWEYTESIDLLYTPVPPVFAARSDLFLLPDAAFPALVARGAAFAASRIAGLPSVPQPPMAMLTAEATAAVAAFLATVSLTPRTRLSRVRPRWS